MVFSCEPMFSQQLTLFRAQNLNNLVGKTQKHKNLTVSGVLHWRMGFNLGANYFVMSLPFTRVFQGSCDLTLAGFVASVLHV